MAPPTIRLSRLQGNVLRAWALWTIYVWATRMWNIWRDADRDIPFKAVHSVLAGISIAFAIGGFVIVARGRRAASDERTATDLAP